MKVTVLFVIVVLVLFLQFVRTETCTTGGCVRGFLSDLQSEYDKLAVLNSKLNRTIDILTSSMNNSTNNSSSVDMSTINSIIKTRTAQLKKITEAQNVLSLEINILTSQCNSFSGDNCDGVVVTCFGLNKNSSSVCSGHGKCIAQNICQCNAYYSGVDCSSIAITPDDPLGRKYIDGTYAKSCKAYRNATAPYLYLNKAVDCTKSNLIPLFSLSTVIWIRG